MAAATRLHVRKRAHERCEYCLLPQQCSPFKHHIEHITARQHGGTEKLDNLALACHRCNLNKGPNLSAIDPASGEVVSIFHPRRDAWDDHFQLAHGYIQGRTPTGRATVRLLLMNDPRRVELRQFTPPA